MKLTLCITVCLLIPASLWGQRSKYDPAARLPAKQQSSFIDFALKQVNPSNADYGCQIDEARKTVLDATIKTNNWWTAVVASVLLVLSFFMVLHQHREGRRRERIASRFVTQSQNALLDAQRELESVTRKHDELADSLSRAGETTPKSRSADGESKVQKPQPAAVRTATVTNVPGHNASARSDSGQTNQPATGDPGANYAAQVRAMQQKMMALQSDLDAGRKREDAARERERNLQRELEKLRRQLATEQAGKVNLGS